MPSKTISKRKKQHWSWRATKAVVGGLGKGSLWVVKKIASGVYSGGRLAVRKAKEKKKASMLMKQPHYAIPAVYKEFGVVKQVLGDYSVAGGRLLRDSLIVLIFGKRGSGKSALGFRIMENIHSHTGRKCYVLGVKQEVLPQWITTVDDVEQLANGGVLLVDEGAVAFGARESMQAKNRELGKLMAIARHKDLTLLFVTQNTGMLDKNVLKLADSLLIKEGSLLQLEMERAEVKKFYQKAHDAFGKLPGKQKYFYMVDSDFEGVLESELPRFWSSTVSKSRA